MALPAYRVLCAAVRRGNAGAAAADSPGRGDHHTDSGVGVQRRHRPADAHPSGFIKRTRLSAFSNIRSNGLIAINLEEGDSLTWVRLRCPATASDRLQGRDDHPLPPQR